MTFLALAGFIALCLGAGFGGAQATRTSVESWYPTLRKPSWTPPRQLFAPVWTVLYILMAVAAWRVWERADGDGWPLTVFGVQLALNLAWSWFFFGLRMPALALVDIVLLWLAIVTTMGVFYGYDPVASWMLAPYLAWVTFASALNAAIVRLNPAETS